MRIVLAVAVAALLPVCGPTSSDVGTASTPSPISAKLPAPVAQPITRTSPGAQIAWLSVQRQGDPYPSLVGVDPTGQIVAQLPFSISAGLHVRRSADGDTLVGVGKDRIVSVSALDGRVPRNALAGPGASVAGDALSPDGRWLAMVLGPSAALQVVDLRTGATRETPLGHDPNTSLPGMGGQIPPGIVWGTAIFSPDSAHLFTLTDWGGPVRITAFALSGDSWGQTATALDDRSGSRFPNCAGPALAARVVDGGRMLAVFCHVDGAVWFVDLATLSGTKLIRAEMKNPFWLSPIFTPDDHLLYLHQWPAFGDQYQVVDLRTRTLLGPKPTPKRVGDPGIFGLFSSVAYAGGTASTVPISPDGLRLYSATSDGIVVLRVPDLAPLAKLAPGVSVEEVWVSGDGKTIYATADQGARVVVMREDGSSVRSVQLPAPNGSFIASERGAS